MKSRLSKGKYWIYGMGVSYFIMDQLFNQWLPYYYLPPKEETGLSPLLPAGLITLALVLSRFIDAVSDPLVGYLSDKTNSKRGKRTPFIALGGLPLGFTMVLFFFPVKITTMTTFISLTIVGGLFFIFYTMVGGPYNALIPDITGSKEERLDLSTVQSVFRLVFTAVAMVLPGLLIPLLGGNNTEKGLRLTIMLLSIIAVLGIYICIFFLDEKSISNNKITESVKFKESSKYILKKDIVIYFAAFFFFFVGFNLLRGMINYYVVSIMQKPKEIITLISVILFGSAALCFPITNKLSKKYSYKKVIMADIIILILGGSGLLFIDSQNSLLAYGLFFICGTGLSGAAFIFPQAMISEIAVSISGRHKVSVEGLLFGIQGFFLKMAFLVQQAIQLNVLVIGSERDSEGLKYATSQGIYAAIAVSLVLFVLSLLFYFLKKEKEDSEL
ncbi:MAG: MFS transporter [Fusobacteriales bacterium]|nr:MFS transporter [Fusobacteriales bacterium]